MADADAGNGTFASGRYLKRKRVQVNYRIAELDVDDTDNDQAEADSDQPDAHTDSDSDSDAQSEAESISEQTYYPMFKKRRCSKRVPKPLPRIPKRHIFPFLKLPAEVRNMIYGYALSDPAGFNFTSTTRDRRRICSRVSSGFVSKFTNRERRRHYYYHPHHTAVSVQPKAVVEDLQPSAMAPSLLAINKQVFEEASSFLYNNELVFADTLALYTFLLNLDPAGATRPRKIRLFNWNDGRSTKAYGSACFALLVSAINVTEFHLDVGTTWYRSATAAAQRFYRDAFPWLEAVGRAKRKPDAAVDMLHIIYEETKTGAETVSSENNMKAFKVELRALLLHAQSKRTARMN